MYRSYKITDFEVGDYLYKFEEDKWGKLWQDCHSGRSSVWLVDQINLTE